MKTTTLAVWGAFSFLLFTILSALVFGGFFTSLDLLATLNLQRIVPRFLDLPFSIFSLIGSFEITTFVLFLIFLRLLKHKHFLAIFGLFLYVIGHIIEISGKFFLFHPSPPFSLFRGVGIIEPNVYIHTNYSYPSGHLFRTAYLVVLIFFLINKKFIKVKNTYISGFLIVFLLLMIISRIYLAEHWLSDVLGGLMLGLSFGLFTSVFIYLDKNRSVK